MQYLVRQPNGFWAVWNTITDEFSCYDANLDELADAEEREAARQVRLRWRQRADNVEAFGRTWWQSMSLSRWSRAGGGCKRRRWKTSLTGNGGDSR